MLAYLMRHGDYVNASTDADRVLTDWGKQATMDILQILARVNAPKPQVVISSSLRRAQQTALLVREQFAPNSRHEMSNSLSPETDPNLAINFIRMIGEDNSVAFFVGHDPLFSSLGSILLDAGRVVAPFGKSTLALFKIHSFEMPRITAELKLFLTPTAS